MGNKKKFSTSFNLGSSRSSGPAMKFKPPLETGSRGGTRPLAEAASVQSVLGMMVVHVARKIMYGVDLSHKVGLYIVGVLLLSVVGDFSKASTHYLARPDNFFNVYMVKFGWGWTLLVALPPALLTGLALGEGPGAAMALARTAAGTLVWAGFTNGFDIVRRYALPWFDTSGHCFILAWSALFLAEESASYQGWESLQGRLSGDSPLGARMRSVAWLVRSWLPFQAALYLLWNLMFASTTLFYHTLAEKVVGTVAAVVCWVVLYRGVYLGEVWRLPRWSVERAQRK